MRLRDHDALQREGELALVDLDAAVVDAAAQHLADSVVEGVVDDIINIEGDGRVVALLNHARREGALGHLWLGLLVCEEVYTTAASNDCL